MCFIQFSTAYTFLLGQKHREETVPGNTFSQLFQSQTLSAYPTFWRAQILANLQLPSHLSWLWLMHWISKIPIVPLLGLLFPQSSAVVSGNCSLLHPYRRNAAMHCLILVWESAITSHTGCYYWESLISNWLFDSSQQSLCVIPLVLLAITRHH